MKSRILLCVFALVLVGGCGSSEPSSIADGLEQSEIDKYNAMIADEAKRSSEAGQIGANE
ncbi:hypothetical protein LF1_23860 [Rubripirellula obstinata]|uniref:Secreted protein n=1 Tax=Rubripirellula obstinata TaxID=406547 RepID=A0A5B1CJF6_9BACT|nr:hypothetical protein [Rubripirellula obstinata]KAA1259849.1 hypothetical protein LF1_23860 [Rubripirellula obstinata]